MAADGTTRAAPLAPATAEALQAQLPLVAERVIAAIRAEVPSYSGALSGRLGAGIRQGVEVSLHRFVALASGAANAEAGPVGGAQGLASALGAEEAKSGRSLEALLAAYRVGARVAWRDVAEIAVGAGVVASDLAHLAERVFAYIDELSAASAAGHARELSTSSRERERAREALVRALLDGADNELLRRRAAAAAWQLPATVTPLLVTQAHLPQALAGLGESTLSGEVAPGTEPGLHAVLLPDGVRGSLVRLLAAVPGVLGPTVVPAGVPGAVARARRCMTLGIGGRGLTDSDDHLAALVVSADPDALADLQRRVLAPLAELRPVVRERLVVTLRSWLMHQGRRDLVAAQLFVHPQTVRYRMHQLREAFGEGLADPDTLVALMIALGATPGPV